MLLFEVRSTSVANFVFSILPKNTTQRLYYIIFNNVYSMHVVYNNVESYCSTNQVRGHILWLWKICYWSASRKPNTWGTWCAWCLHPGSFLIRLRTCCSFFFFFGSCYRRICFLCHFKTCDQLLCTRILDADLLPPDCPGILLKAD